MFDRNPQTKNVLAQCAKALWAKSDPHHPLWCHLLDAAAVCEQLINSIGSSRDIPPTWVMYLTALHDIGKADPEFQVQNDSEAAILINLGLTLPPHKSAYRHEARSGEWISKHLRSDQHRWGRHAASVVSAALRGHHGNFNPRPSNDESEHQEYWESLRNHLAKIIADTLCLQNEPFSPTDFDNASTTGVELIGRIVLSDWIASNSELFRYPLLNTFTTPGDYWQCAQEEAAHAINALRLGRPDGRPATTEIPTFQDVWPVLTDLRPSQRALEIACRNGIPPGLAIIEAPMGEGKTESAVYLAECWRLQLGSTGTYIALPTMATSNSMHSRYSGFLQERRPDGSYPRLVHGMAWLIDDASPETGASTSGEDPDEENSLACEWFRPSKRALIAPEGVGTIDQVLMAALNVKHGFLRLLGLSSKVLIIDEVHAYDEYMTTILERLLEWCRALSVPVIMLSATLSSPQKKRLIEAYGGTYSGNDARIEPYPLITLLPLDQSEQQSLPVDAQTSRRVLVKQHLGTLDDSHYAATLAADLVRDGGCVCMLMNTVKAAQAVYRDLESLLPDPRERLLFHARYPAGARSDIEDRVVGLFGKDAVKSGRRPSKAVLVATQVVEQSLDLDFDVMVSQLAPIDLLFQRTGRMRRHADTPRPPSLKEEFHILMPDMESPNLGSSQYVYGEAALLRTIAVLDKRDRFVFPEDFRPLIDACYGDEYVANSIVSEREQFIADLESTYKRESDANKALDGLIPPPNPRVFDLAESPLPRDESDEASQSYFYLSTRLGGTTRPVMLIGDPLLIEAAQRQKAPCRNVLREMFRHKVDIPAYWLTDAVPSGGFEPFICAKWLRGTIVIPTRSSRWQGIRKGKTFEIVDDDALGVEMKED